MTKPTGINRLRELVTADYAEIEELNQVASELLRIRLEGLMEYIDGCDDPKCAVFLAAPKADYPTFAHDLAMYLTRNNQQHTFTYEELQAGIEQFMRERR